MPGTLVEDYYDEFNRRLVLDYFVPNARVSAQYAFLLAALAPTTGSILIVGCGTGELGVLLAERFGAARILALDISQQNIETARRLFAHPRVEYQKRDILQNEVGGSWQVIVFPDSYEHIRVVDRPRLHALLKAALAPGGRVLLACPTVMKQRSLREAGQGLQIIDEDVGLADVQQLARDVDAQVSFFSLVQVWGNYDYLHAVVERGTEQLGELSSGNAIPLHRGKGPWRRVLAGGLERLHILRSPLRSLRALGLATWSRSKP